MVTNSRYLVRVRTVVSVSGEFWRVRASNDPLILSDTTMHYHAPPCLALVAIVRELGRAIQVIGRSLGYRLLMGLESCENSSLLSRTPSPRFHS